MIYGIGTDIVQISRIDTAFKRWGGRFLRRVFTEAEIEYCNTKAQRVSHLALRFAAKEAFAKALGLGFRNGISFRQIEVVHTHNGSPALKLHSKSKDFCEKHGIERNFLSLSDDGDYAIAMVVLEA
ncbi:MAG: holo-ACP synthase [Deltaproteobacteria bacterium]|nr:holo-ACP synthase [Deltaproteobacteria bacterium]MBW2317867.1 holo-ACP synthase [Deltaproteobacteria bacterium]MBW2601347.1 holo-ACP synthase [Deltaproteobacteria bacterium]OEU44225.1 MAG: hypothetical protein BBJ60_04355 [Desulfobacterales bacterium S7086C20]